MDLNHLGPMCFLWMFALSVLLVSPGTPTLAEEATNGGASVLIYQPLAGQGVQTMTFAISSTGFQSGAEIPKKFTCDGADVSPELSWVNPPSNTQSFAIIADDPDAPVGTWTHWVLFDLPAKTVSLPEGVAKVDEVPSGDVKAATISAKSATEDLVRPPANRIVISSSSTPSTEY